MNIETKNNILELALAAEGENADVLEFKGMDFKNLNLKDWFRFAKANKSYGEPGISGEELWILHKATETLGHGPITIFETGICYGTTTRYFIIRNLKYGGELYACEIVIRELFQKTMEELGLWKYINVLGHSMKVPWDKPIDLLFIDSEHAFSDALGEYMKYRIFLRGESIVGFHDTDNCYGVKRTVEVINEIDNLELIGEITGKLSAGIKFFKVKGLGQKQAIYNKLYKDGKL